MTGQTTNAVRLVRSMWPATEPARWSLRRLRHLADIRPSNVDKKSVDGEANVRLCNYTDVYYNDSITSDMSFMPATAPLAQVKRFELRPDDVLVTKDSETPADIAIAAHVRDELPGVLCGYHLAILRPLPHVDGRFLVYALQSRPLAAQTDVAASWVTRFALSTGALADLTLPVPGRAEQLAIADFLDRETAKIDALVARKQRLVGLLQEKRTALISHAVTKGLDPDVPMKDSGIEWLGAIPAHWDAGVLRRAARLESGHTPSRQHPEYWEDCSVPWFTLADIWQVRPGIQEYVSETNECVSEVGLAHSSARLLQAGTVLLSRTASVGFSAIAERPMATSQDFANWVCGDALLPEYLLYVYRSMRGELLKLTMGSTHKTIYMPIIAKLAGPLPPMDEQRLIVEHIRRETRRVDALNVKLAQAIERLREYRSALITAAVTGQVDVRAAL